MLFSSQSRRTRNQEISVTCQYLGDILAASRYWTGLGLTDKCGNSSKDLPELLHPHCIITMGPDWAPRPFTFLSRFRPILHLSAIELPPAWTVSASSRYIRIKPDFPKFFLDFNQFSNNHLQVNWSQSQSQTASHSSNLQCKCAGPQQK